MSTKYLNILPLEIYLPVYFAYIVYAWEQNICICMLMVMVILTSVAHIDGNNKLLFMLALERGMCQNTRDDLIM